MSKPKQAFIRSYNSPLRLIYTLSELYCDGNYVDAPLAIATDAALPASTQNPAYDLSSYLPKDDYNYMVDDKMARKSTIYDLVYKANLAKKEMKKKSTNKKVENNN